ncbi:MAG: Xylan 1,4-beta-xylosidase [Bacteroidota bacterium]
MKASFEQISWNEKEVIQSKHIKLTRFDSPLHYHPALELTYIIQGKGKRFVGNSIEDFKEGDLILLGSNLPHCWQNDRSNLLLEDPKGENSEAIVIHFSENIILNNGLENLKSLLEIAKQGISLDKFQSFNLKNRILKFNSKDPLDQLIDLLFILKQIQLEQENIRILNPIKENYHLNNTDLERINKVYSYIIANFTHEVHLDEAAHLANMTETAFCRYLKKVTRKTFIEIVTDFRIKFACEQLKNTEKSVLEICFESGFGNVSHFNKIFKKNRNQTPLQFRKTTQKFIFE